MVSIQKQNHISNYQNKPYVILECVTSINIDAANSIALTILHVMGHNAGIGSSHNPSGYPRGIMTSGGGLLDAMQNGYSFADFTSMSRENKQNRVWGAFVRSYFNGSGDATSIFRDLHRGFLMSYILQFINLTTE